MTLASNWLKSRKQVPDFHILSNADIKHRMHFMWKVFPGSERWPHYLVLRNWSIYFLLTNPVISLSRMDRNLAACDRA